VPPALFAFYLLLSTSLVLYVYRVAVAGVNMSVLRLLLLGWLAWLALDVVRGRIRPERRYWPLLGIVAGIMVVNVADFLTLGGHPALRRDIANHVLNLALAGLVTVYVTTESRRVALLRAFVYSSLVTSAITLYSAIHHRLPFESLIRTLGSTQAQGLSYISDDTLFTRATAAFYDPNFYGIYSLLVLVSILYLWLFDRPSRQVAVFFALNMVCLSLTLSRTATVGLLAAMGVSFLLVPRSRWFAVAASVAAVGLLYTATAVQSHEGRKRLVAQADAVWDDWTRERPSEPAATRKAPASRPGTARPGTRPSPARPSGDAARVSPASPDRIGEPDRPALEDLGRTTRLAQARVADARSLEGRLAHIRQGLRVFGESPLWGQGSAALLAEHTQWSSAHVSYLTLLARYGLLGTAVYVAFLIWPLWVVWRRSVPMASRYFVTVTLGTLMVVYLGYDILLFFEIQYLFFGLVYAVAVQVTANTAMGPPPPS
jgi:hypothetical protein